MSRISTIELFKEDMNFSAGHFTIFSQTVRENLHGHNYNLYVAFTTTIEDEEGLSFDYRHYKDKLHELCSHIDETVILPGKSKHLKITRKDGYEQVRFNNEVMMFLPRDVKVLPISNVTVEELSDWFLQQILSDQAELDKNKIVGVTVKVFSGPGQSGSANWTK
jgi:6-pyruvoyltetrahydropterin/6-carboxytetrahydropterin synthase